MSVFAIHFRLSNLQFSWMIFRRQNFNNRSKKSLVEALECCSLTAYNYLWLVPCVPGLPFRLQSYSLRRKPDAKGKVRGIIIFPVPKTRTSKIPSYPVPFPRPVERRCGSKHTPAVPDATLAVLQVDDLSSASADEGEFPKIGTGESPLAHTAAKASWQAGVGLWSGTIHMVRTVRVHGRDAARKGIARDRDPPRGHVADRLF
jgi:hypothetical protein